MAGVLQVRGRVLHEEAPGSVKFSETLARVEKAMRSLAGARDSTDPAAARTAVQDALRYIGEVRFSDYQFDETVRGLTRAIEEHGGTVTGPDTSVFEKGHPRLRRAADLLATLKEESDLDRIREVIGDALVELAEEQVRYRKAVEYREHLMRSLGMEP